MQIEAVDLIKLVAPVSVLALIFGIYKYRLDRGLIRIRAGRGHGICEGGVGTYLAAAVVVSNVGRAPIVFGGLQASDPRGNTFYPSCDVESGTSIAPQDSLRVLVPAGHLTNPPAARLWVLDGVGRRKALPSRRLRSLVSELAAETRRLRSLGLSEVCPERRLTSGCS